MHMTGESFSFSAQVWKRLKKNKGAIFGLVMICIAVTISIFGYLIAPDTSPNADLQTIEIQAKKPGYTQRFLKIEDKKNLQVGLFRRLINGAIADYRYIPITSYKINGDSLIVNKYVDEDTTVLQSYS